MTTHQLFENSPKKFSIISIGLTCSKIAIKVEFEVEKKHFDLVYQCLVSHNSSVRNENNRRLVIISSDIKSINTTLDKLCSNEPQHLSQDLMARTKERIQSLNKIPSKISTRSPFFPPVSANKFIELEDNDYLPPQKPAPVPPHCPFENDDEQEFSPLL